MERDSRRDHGQWRGCHTFQDIVTVRKTHKCNGGLTMGETYYYYYEVDGSYEIHDPSMPSTTVCPYLPGQTLNTLEVPIEYSPKRLRSASMNSIRPSDFKTMDPQAKFITPRPAPTAPNPFRPRVGTSDGVELNHKSSSRSLSPVHAPSWTGKARRLFGLKHQGRASDVGQTPESIIPEEILSKLRKGERISGTQSASEGSRSRDMSPEALRRFLSDGTESEQSTPSETPKPTIPDDILEEDEEEDEIEEENEDDDDFAFTTFTESTPFTTLSPPPFKRSLSAPSVGEHKLDPKTRTARATPKNIVVIPETFYDDALTPTDPRRPSLTSFHSTIPRTHFEYSVASPTATSPRSPLSVVSPKTNSFSFFDEMVEDDDRPSTVHGDDLDGQYKQQHFPGYSLPQNTTNDSHHTKLNEANPSFGSPEIVARSENGLPVGNNPLLTLQEIDGGLDDLISELGWIAGTS